MKYSTLILLASIFLIGCQSKTGKQSGNTPISGSNKNFFPVTSYLQEQVNKLDSFPGALIMVSTHNGMLDSGYIQAADVRSMVKSFFKPDFRSPASTGVYSEKSFEDKSTQSVIITYEAITDTATLSRADVYIDPDKNAIKRLYLVRTINSSDSTIQQQLLWQTDQNFTLITTINKDGYATDMHQQKVLWAEAMN